MSTIINADTSNGLKLTSDTSGEIKLQSAGADIATVSSTGLAMASGKTLTGDAVVTGKVLKQTSLTNTTRTALPTSADYWISFGTITKNSATSNLIITASIAGFGNYSGVAGAGIRIDTTYLYQPYTYNATGSTSNTHHLNLDFGTMGGAGSKTVYWGWKPANGVTTGKPFSVLNPTSTDEARYQNTRSTITVWEVEV